MNLNKPQNPQLNIAVVSGSLLDLKQQLAEQEIIYVTEKDLIKANNANWEMTKLLFEIQKLNTVVQ